jgi:ATP-dependent protease Clp ATPase subunit
MDEYGVDEQTASRAFLDANDRAQEAFSHHLAQKFGRAPGWKEDLEGFEISIHTPKEIKAHLDKYVIGQEEYKKRISIAAAYHFAMLKYMHENPSQKKVKRFRKKNTITAGPSGSGKTYCVEVLGDLLEVPTLIVDATDYTEAGYVGKSADDMIRELIDMAPGTTRQQQAAFIGRHGGIIFIDEIDKKAKDGRLIGHDISREGFQRAVLKLIERKLVAIDNPMSPASQIQEAMDRQRGVEPDPMANMISTEKILFILGGSFERPHEKLESIVKQRLAHKGGMRKEDGGIVVRGFAPEGEDHGKKRIQKLLCGSERRRLCPVRIDTRTGRTVPDPDFCQFAFQKRSDQDHERCQGFINRSVQNGIRPVRGESRYHTRSD